eukprot:3150490-Pyramimonas_sp.AAC.1
MSRSTAGGCYEYVTLHSGWVALASRVGLRSLGFRFRVYGFWFYGFQVQLQQVAPVAVVSRSAVAP